MTTAKSTARGLCGRPWCTRRHKPNAADSRQAHEHIWFATRSHRRVKVELHPTHVGLDRDQRAAVFIAVGDHWRTGDWVYMDLEDVRELAANLTVVADSAEAEFAEYRARIERLAPQEIA